MTSVLEETGLDVERGEATWRRRQRLADAAVAQGLWQDPEAARGRRGPVSTWAWAPGRQTRRE